MTHILSIARTKLKKLEQTNEQAEQAGTFSQAELRMRKTQQVNLVFKKYCLTKDNLGNKMLTRLIIYLANGIAKICRNHDRI